MCCAVLPSHIANAMETFMFVILVHVVCVFAYNVQYNVQCVYFSGLPGGNRVSVCDGGRPACHVSC